MEKVRQFLCSFFNVVMEHINDCVNRIKTTHDYLSVVIVVLAIVLFTFLFIRILVKVVRKIRWNRYLHKQEKGYRKRTKQIRITQKWEKEFYSQNNTKGNGLLPHIKDDAERERLEKQWQEYIDKHKDDKSYFGPPTDDKASNKKQSQSQSNTGESESIIVNDISGYHYEELCAEYYEKNGYYCELTPKSGDYGVDVIATDRRNGKRIAIQCKFYGDGRKVGIKAVQEVYFGKQHYGCEEAWVVTNCEYTEQAYTAAEDAGVELLNLVVTRSKN